MRAPPLLLGIVALLSGAALVPACTYDFTLGPSPAELSIGDAGTSGGDPDTGSGSRACSGTTCSCPESATCDLKCGFGLAASPCATTCAAGSKCTLSCNPGGCITNCAATASCTVDCLGGNCTTNCPAGSDCTVNCTGGNCKTSCDQAASCTVNCIGGNCSCTGAGCK